MSLRGAVEEGGKFKCLPACKQLEGERDKRHSLTDWARVKTCWYVCACVTRYWIKRVTEWEKQFPQAYSYLAKPGRPDGAWWQRWDRNTGKPEYLPEGNSPASGRPRSTGKSVVLTYHDKEGIPLRVKGNYLYSVLNKPLNIIYYSTVSHNADAWDRRNCAMR